MSAEHGLDHVIVFLLCPGDKICILLDGLQTLLLAVALGNLIAQAGTDPQFLGDIFDREQASGYLEE